MCRDGDDKVSSEDVAVLWSPLTVGGRREQVSLFRVTTGAREEVRFGHRRENFGGRSWVERFALL